MSEQPVPVDTPQELPMSFTGKAAGVFYRPSKVFESMMSSGVKFVDWFAPLAFMIIVAGITSFVQLKTPALRTQILQQRETAIEGAVREGKVSAKEGSQEEEMAEENIGTGAASTIVLRIFAVSVVLFIAFFVISLVWYLVGKFGLQGPVDYSRGMAVAGLSSWITGVGFIVALIISVLTSRLDGGLQLGMLVAMKPDNLTYLILSKLNLFMVWSLIVVSIGLGVFSGKKGFRAAVWVFGISILWQALSIGFGRVFLG